MVAAIKLLRSLVAGTRPTGRTYGEPYVNFGDNQFGIFDSSNTVRDLLGVPIFSVNATYATGNPVNYQGSLYVAKGAVAAGAWNAAQWTQISGVSGFSTINVQRFTTSGTYTPTSGMKYCVMECVGGGAGGGGAATSAATSWVSGGGGASGGYSRRTVSAATVGASQAVTIGAGGTAGVAAGGTGGNGGATSVGTLCVANGGGGGLGGNDSGALNGAGGTPGAAGTGDVALPGNPGPAGINGYAGNVASGSAFGASSFFGGGPQSVITGSGSKAGVSAPANSGAGGTGGIAANTVGSNAGGAGGTGLVIITEYI